MTLRIEAFSASLRVLATLLVIASIGGCSLIGDKPFTIHSPRPQPAAVADATPVDWQLAIEQPWAGATQSTPDLLVMPSPGVYEVYADARWRDIPPTMLGSLLLETFERSGRLVGVSRAAAGVNTDFVLSSELRDFQIEFVDGAPRAHVQVHARLLAFGDNRIVASRTFDASEPAAAQDAGSAARAIEAALARALAELRDWTFEVAATHRAATR